MKKWHLVLGQVLMVMGFTLSIASAAPNINDGFMSYNSTDDWGGLGPSTITTFKDGFSGDSNLTNVSVEEQRAINDYSDDMYDVEELGLYINNNILYIGLQTQYNLSSDPVNADGVAPGDFMFNFDESSPTFNADNTDSNDFALDFTVNSDNSVNMTLLAGNMTGTGVGTDRDNYGTDWGIEKDTDGNYLASYFKTFERVGQFTAGNNGVDENDDYYYDYKNGYYTLEAAIDLSLLTGELGTLFAGYASNYDSVTMYWQPSCGNDFLAVRSDFGFTGGTSPTPEPATLLLFGMGLLGAGAMGRKRHKK